MKNTYWTTEEANSCLLLLTCAKQVRPFRYPVVVESLSHVWLCDPMHCSATGHPVPHYLPEFAQVHVPWVSDAIQPSHPLMPSSPLVFSLSQHQELFWWVGPSHQMYHIRYPAHPHSHLSKNISRNASTPLLPPAYQGLKVVWQESIFISVLACSQMIWFHLHKRPAKQLLLVSFYRLGSWGS